MTRRSFLTLPAVVVTQTTVAGYFRKRPEPHIAASLAQEPNITGFRISGRLVEDTSDLQLGYYAVCGLETGTCQAEHAIGISVHPKNELFLKPLQSLVGQDVIVSVLPR